MKYRYLILFLLLALCVSGLFAGSVTFDGRRICYVDGKPFFPIGIYHASPGPIRWINERACEKKLDVGELQFAEVLDEVEDKGFNTVVYSWFEVSRGHLAEYKKRGLYLIAECGQISEESQNRLFSLGRDVDNILMWYGFDEPGGDNAHKIELTKKFYIKAKTHDPYRPVGAATPTIAVLPKVIDSLDVVMPDYYTIRDDQSMVDFAEWIGQTNSIAQNSCKPMWVVPQAHACRISDSLSLNLPTANQLRCQAYLSIIKGATGLIWYGYFTGEYHDNPNGREHFFLPDHEIWDYFKELNAEINLAASMFILKGLRQEVDFIENEGVQAALWKTDKGNFIIAANPQEDNVKFTVGSILAKKGFVLNSCREVAVKDNKFSDTLGPCGVSVYRFE